jgi:imidazolonepropionase-like amidohydrolase
MSPTRIALATSTVGIALASFGAAWSRPPAPPSPRTVAITDVNVVDVEYGKIVPHQTIIVRGDRIVAVLPFRTARIPSDAVVWNAPGRYVIPGLWDMHVHQTVRSSSPRTAELIDRETATYFRALLLAGGVTGVRDAAGDLRRLRAAQSRSGDGHGVPAPRALLTGEKLGDAPVVPGAPFPLRTVDDVRRSVRMLRDAGASYVKLGEVPHRILVAALDACREVALPCVAHVPAPMKPEEAAARGLRSFEHLFYLPEHTSSLSAERLLAVAQELGRPSVLQRLLYKTGLRSRPPSVDSISVATHDSVRARSIFLALAASETWVTPTLLLHDLLTGAGRQTAGARDTSLMIATPTPGILRDTRAAGPRQQSRRQFELMTQLVREMHSAGVHLLAGTDAPLQSVPGRALHAELILLQQAGLRPIDALRAATLEPARYLRGTDTLGTVQAGKVADLVVLSRNPLEDVSRVTEIEGVVSRGRLLRRPELDAQVAIARSALPALRNAVRNPLEEDPFDTATSTAASRGQSGPGAVPVRIKAERPDPDRR